MPKEKKEFEQLFKEYKDYAKKNGFHLNPDRKKENNKIVCPCIHHKREMKENGHCHCFLFVK